MQHRVQQNTELGKAQQHIVLACVTVSTLTHVMQILHDANYTSEEVQLTFSTFQNHPTIVLAMQN